MVHRSFRRAAALLVLGACASAPPSAPVATVGSASLAPEDREAREIIDAVAVVRGALWRRPIKIRRLGTAECQARLLGGNVTADAEVDRLLHTTVRILAPQMTSGEASEIARRVRGEDVGGYYRTESDELTLCEDGPAETEEEKSARFFAIAHEAGHAWQDQTIGLRRLAASAETLDEYLAVRAAVEGDASLTAILVRAHRSGTDLRTAVADARRLRGALWRRELSLSADEARGTRSFRALMRGMVLFPYLSGKTFALDLYAAGGAQLMWRVLAAPPRTTQAVLHPQWFLDGQAGEAVRPTFRGPTEGHLGERLLAVALAPCVGSNLAEDLASFWTGDSYGLAESGALSLAVRFSTEDAAAQVAEALRKFPSCGRNRPDFTAAVGQNGDLVKYADGPSSSEVRAALSQLDTRTLAVPREHPYPPFGALTVPRRNRADAATLSTRGKIRDGVYESRQLGLSLALFSGARVSVETRGYELTVVQSSPMYVFELWFVPSPVTPAATDPITARDRSLLLDDSLLGEDELRETAEAPIDLGWTSGRQRAWSMKDMDHRRLRFLRACGGRAMLVIREQWSTPAGATALDALARTFRVHDPSPPSCAGLPVAAAP